MTIFKHALKATFQWWVNVLVIIFLPLAFIFIPKTTSSYPNGVALYGLVNLYSAFLLCKPIAEDRTKGITLRIASTPTSYISYLGSHLAAYLMVLLLQNVIFITGLKLYWQEQLTDAHWLFLIYFLLNVLTLSFSLCWNSLFRSYNISFAIFSGIGSLMCLVSGISVPLSTFPEKYHKLMMIIPTYWFAYGLDAIYSGKILLTALSIFVMVIYSGIFFLIGSRRSY